MSLWQTTFEWKTGYTLFVKWKKNSVATKKFTKPIKSDICKKLVKRTSTNISTN